MRSPQTSSLGDGEPGEVRVNLGKAVYTGKILATGKPQTAYHSKHRNMNVYRYEGRDGCKGRRVSTVPSTRKLKIHASNPRVARV